MKKFSVRSARRWFHCFFSCLGFVCIFNPVSGNRWWSILFLLGTSFRWGTTIFRRWLDGGRNSYLFFRWIVLVKNSQFYWFYCRCYGMRDWLSTSTTRVKATTTIYYIFSHQCHFYVLITHDVSPIVFYIFFSTFILSCYQLKDSWKEFLFSGALWGGAFLSKYLPYLSFLFILFGFLLVIAKKEILKK